MSETDAPAAEYETIQNFSVEAAKVNRNGKDVEAIRFTFGDPKRTITTRKLGLGDEFDLIGIAGDLSNNPKWMIMAGLAFSVDEMDGVPQVRPRNLMELRGMLDRLGVAGLSAYLKAIATVATSDEAVVAAAKN